jgi:hypothetical protein
LIRALRNHFHDKNKKRLEGVGSNVYHENRKWGRLSFWAWEWETAGFRSLASNGIYAVGRLLGKSEREKPLADWIMATGVGLLGNELRDNEAEWVERNDGWRREPFI